MPFRSKKQQRFMFAVRPKGVDVEKWSDETDFSKLPEKASKKKKKKKDKSDLAGPGQEALDAATLFEMLARMLNEQNED